jgi:4-hydroxy-4-methyl-2-oxoglutarate aldolase
MKADQRIERLRRLDACALSDALDSLRLHGFVGGLAPLTIPVKTAGRIITVKLGSAQTSLPPGPVRHLGTAAVELASPGDVVVVEQRTGIDAACWGGLLSLGAKLRGVSGLIADGLVRDVDEARQIGLPIYARGCIARTARGRLTEVGMNVPIQVGDITVSPGDYVLADGSGVVFVAAADCDRLLDVAEDIAAKELRMARELLSGRPISQVMSGNYEGMLHK